MGHPAGFMANPQQMRTISAEVADTAKVIGQPTAEWSTTTDLAQ